MSESLFNPKKDDLSAKIVVGLERVSEAFKALLWEQAKNIGLSPIQIQILLFVKYHKIEYCNVSHLAKEFNVTKPTVSDAVKVLVKKELLIKDYSSSDSRSYSLLLSTKGEDIVNQTEHFAQPIQKGIDKMSSDQLSQLYGTLSQLIYQLNQQGILNVQRTCYACQFYSLSDEKHHCALLQQELKVSDIKLDCPEFEEKG